MVVENGREDLLADLTAIRYSFCARMYGQRRATRKTETIIKQLQAKDETPGQELEGVHGGV